MNKILDPSPIYDVCATPAYLGGQTTNYQMNAIKTSALALLAIGSALLTNAQTVPSAAPVGVLGHRYTEINFGAQDIKGINRNVYGLGIEGNTPVSSNLDVGLGYTYNWIGGAFKGHANTLGATATAYTAMNGVKPFVGVGLGYRWEDFGGFDNNYGLWGAAVGVEIPVGAFSFTPAISYGDDFESTANSSQQFNYGVDVNYWFSTASAVTAGASFTNEYRGNGESWNYTVGYRWKF